MASYSELLSNLTPMDFNQRIENLRQSMPDNIEALIVSHLTNIRYLCGFSGSNATLVVTRDKLDFITDGRYRTQSHEELEKTSVEANIHVTAPGQNNWAFLEQILSNIQNIGLEADNISWAAANNYLQHFDKKTFIPSAGIIESLRIIKQTGEVDRIRAACRIADEALEQTKDFLKDLPTEKEFAAALDRKMVDLGASGNSFETIVACGPRGALPHAKPTDHKIETNQLIVIDFGCMVDGYCSDMTRTLSVDEPSDEQLLMYEQVLESQKRGREFVKSGVPTQQVDAQCREYLTDQGVGEYFAHGTGHGVGLDIHESPRLSRASDEILKTSMIVTVEPGIYIESKAGVRIEDTLCVTDDGAEILTSAPKQLVI